MNLDEISAVLRGCDYIYMCPNPMLVQLLCDNDKRSQEGDIWMD